MLRHPRLPATEVQPPDVRRPNITPAPASTSCPAVTLADSTPLSYRAVRCLRVQAQLCRCVTRSRSRHAQSASNECTRADVGGARCATAVHLRTPRVDGNGVVAPTKRRRALPRVHVAWLCVSPQARPYLTDTCHAHHTSARARSHFPMPGCVILALQSQEEWEWACRSPSSDSPVAWKRRGLRALTAVRGVASTRPSTPGDPGRRTLAPWTTTRSFLRLVKGACGM